MWQDKSSSHPTSFLDDFLWHLQVALNEYTGLISQQTLNDDILPWAENPAGILKTCQPVAIYIFFKAPSLFAT